MLPLIFSNQPGCQLFANRIGAFDGYFFLGRACRRLFATRATRDEQKERKKPEQDKLTLEAGDIICAIDRTPLQSMSQFQEMVHNLKPGDPVVFQIERKGKLQYLSFEME